MFKSLINKETFFLVFSQLCFGALGALIVYMGVIQRHPPTIATVNITGLVDSFIRETTKQSLSEVEMKQKASLFSDQLTQIIKRISGREHLVLVPSEAVISGAPDLTQEVAYEIKRGLSK